MARKRNEQQRDPWERNEIAERRMLPKGVGDEYRFMGKVLTDFGLKVKGPPKGHPRKLPRNPFKGISK